MIPGGQSEGFDYPIYTSYKLQKMAEKLIILAFDLKLFSCYFGILLWI